ncbi:P21-Rho-binding domain-containing protein [Mycena vitilis]|nr:P21-Rho-binding domain-containing protein [Mycena vitilis]
MGVSNPTNFVHKVHVGFDPVSGAFTGMPDQWSKLLTKSAITREDYAKDPQAVLDVLEFYTDHQKRELEREREMDTSAPARFNAGTGLGGMGRSGMGASTSSLNDRPPIKRQESAPPGLDANGSSLGSTAGPPPVKLLQPAKKPTIQFDERAGEKVGTQQGVAAAAAALEKKGDGMKEKRISTMTEVQIMEKLRQVVCDDDPKLIYSKIKKVGQGASGHVYVANTLATGKKVAIKEMDLSHQPRKELIVNEILVMKESQHPNIVNFIESYLVKANELWVIMECGHPLRWVAI